jgi:tetratricopeptide (TPR) repeat protein
MRNIHITATICFAFALIILSGCVNIPSDARKGTAPAKGVELNGEEQKSYQDALEAIKANEAERAISTLVKISNSHPEHFGAWINLANAYLKEMKINEAENATTRAKKINAKVAEIYNLQGLIAVHKGEYTNAEKSYKEALQLRENYPAAHYNLGLLYDIYYQDLDRAIVQYDRYLELNGGSDKKTQGWVGELKQKVKHRNK